MNDIYEMDKSLERKILVTGYIGCAVGVYLFYRSVGMALVGGAAVVFLRGYIISYYREYKKHQIKEQFKDMLYQVSSSISAGRNMAKALVDGEQYLEMIYEDNAVFLKEVKRVNRQIEESKVNDETALVEMSDRCQIDDIDNFVETYSICKESGGNLNDALSNCSTTLIEKMEMEKEIKKMMTQRYIEAFIVSIMPILILLFLNLTSSSYLEVMYETFQGKSIMTFALILYAWALKTMMNIFEVSV